MASRTHKTTPEQRAAAVRRCQAGESQSDLARELGVSQQSMFKFLRQAGVAAGPANTPLTDKERAQIVQRYQAGTNTPAIAQELGRGQSVVVDVIDAAGIALSRAEARKRRVPQVQRDAMVTAYQAGATLKAAAGLFNASTMLLQAELKRRGLRARPVGRPGRFQLSDPLAQEILTYYAQGHRVGTLAEWYDCSPDAITTLLKHARVTRRKADTGGYAWTDAHGREFVFRSSWELKTAVWLDQQGTTWDYECESFKLATTSYTPDFWIYDGDQLVKLIDVKGAMYPASLARITEFKAMHTTPLEVWFEADLQQRDILSMPMPEHTNKPLLSSRRIKPGARKRVIALYGQLKSVGEIEQATGVGHTAIMQIVEEAGIKQSKTERRKLRAVGAPVRDQIADAYVGGLSMTAVAAQFGVGRDIVVEEIKRRGLSRSYADAQQVAYERGVGRWQVVK